LSRKFDDTRVYHYVEHGGFFVLKLEEIRTFKNDSCHSTKLAETSRMSTITWGLQSREVYPDFAYHDVYA
jgi:hypothetical protein